MARKGMNGWARLPSGEVAALFHATNLDADCGTVELLLLARTRSDAVQIAKDLELHGLDLKSNPCPPRKEGLAALLASGQPLIWRDFAEDSQWQPRKNAAPHQVGGVTQRKRNHLPRSVRWVHLRSVPGACRPKGRTLRNNVHMSKDLDARLAEADGSDVASTLVDLGCDLSDAGRHHDAELCFRRALALGEDWVSLNVGNELKAQGRLEEAVHAYQAAITAGENDAWLNLGQSLEDLGDLAGAMNAYRHADQVGDKNGALALAYMLREQGEDQEAERLAQRGASLGNLQAVGAAACWAYCRTNDPALEHDLWRGAGHYPSARADLAQILRETGRIEQAREELTRGAKLGEWESWLPLGNLLSDDLGDLDAAEDAYRAGIAAGDRNCHNNLGNLLLERDDMAGAEDQFRQGALLGDQLAVRALRDLLDDDDDE